MYQTRYNQNVLENVVISEIVNNYGEDVYEKCFLETSSTPHWVNFYLTFFRANLVTMVTRDKYIVESVRNRYKTLDGIDVLTLDIEDRIGVFESQYDIITSFGLMDTLVGYKRWQRSLENLCFYLKPGGMLLASGDFTRTEHTHQSIKTRSKAMWVAIAHNNRCTIDKIILNELFMGTMRGNVLVIKKNE